MSALLDSYTKNKSPEVKNVRHNFIPFQTIEVDDVERGAKHEVPNEKHNDEVFDGPDSFGDQFGKEGGAVEQPQPVKDFEPNENDRDRAQCAHLPIVKPLFF